MPCTLRSFADSTGIALDTLKAHGASDCQRCRAAAVEFLCLDERGEVHGAAKCLEPPNAAGRGRWDRAESSAIFGLETMHEARSRGEVVVVDNEVDALALHEHGIPAVAPTGSDPDIPWGKLAGGVERIFVPLSTGTSAPSFLTGMPESVAARVMIVRLAVHESVLALHLDEHHDWQPTWARFIAEAVSWEEHTSAGREVARLDARNRCEELINSKNILDEFGEALSASGFAGDTRAAKLLFLVVVSRLLRHPVSAAVKGPSSAGKSFLVKAVLRFLPDPAFHALTAMTEKALVYDREPLKHRVLVIHEAAGLGETANLIVRTLLSEGRIDYQTV